MSGKKVAAALLVFTFLFSPFAAPQKTCAAVGPAATALAIIAWSFAVHIGLKAKTETYRGMHENLPPNTIRGPHFMERETYWCEDTKGQKFIWDKRNGKWLLKEEWEKIYNGGRSAKCERQK